MKFKKGDIITSRAYPKYGVSPRIFYVEDSFRKGFKQNSLGYLTLSTNLIVINNCITSEDDFDLVTSILREDDDV